MATHSSVLAWRIPGTGEPGGLPSIRSHRVRHDWSDLAAAAAALWIKIWWTFFCKSVGLYVHMLFSFSKYSWRIFKVVLTIYTPTSSNKNFSCSVSSVTNIIIRPLDLGASGRVTVVSHFDLMCNFLRTNDVEHLFSC